MSITPTDFIFNDTPLSGLPGYMLSSNINLAKEMPLHELTNDLFHAIGFFEVSIEEYSREMPAFWAKHRVVTRQQVTAKFSMQQFERLVSSHLQLLELCRRCAVEEKARENPAVKKAYDHYITLVDLTNPSD